MPEKNFDLNTGVNSDTLLNVKLDTQERMRDLYEGFNIPAYKSPFNFVPKTYSTDELLTGDVNLPNIDEALNSTDKEISLKAQEYLDRKAQKSPLYRGLGANTMVKYQEGQNKFTENSWWKENNQTMYGFNPYKSVAENDDMLHKQLWDNYSIGGKAWRGVGTFAGRILSKLVTGLVGTVGDLGAMTWNGLQELGDLITQPDKLNKNNFWDGVFNNWLSRKMSEVDEYTKNHILPTYKTLDYDNKGAWSKLFDPYTWTNSFADGAGFLLQFAVPGAMFGRAAQAGKIARSIGELTTLEELAATGVQGAKIASKLEKAGVTLEQAKNTGLFNRLMGLEISDATLSGKYGGAAAEFLTGSKDVGGISAHIFNTSMEAVSGTKEGFNNTVKDLMAKGMSREKAVEIAGDNAPSQFWINTAILTASNALTNKLLQKAIGNRGFNINRKLDEGTLLNVSNPTTKLGKFFENNSWGNRINYYGKNGIKASLMEGYWEENAQTAAARWARGEYNRQGDDTGAKGKLEVTQKGLTGFFKQLYKQTIDSVQGNDKEAADSIMAGTVIGVIGGTAFSKMSGERKGKIEDKANTIANFINTRDAWLSLNTLSADMYDKDGKIIPEKAQEKAEEIQEKLSKIQSVFSRNITAENLSDPNERERLQHQVFGDYVKAHILNGTEDQLIDRLSSWTSRSEQELSIYGVSPELKEDASKWAKLATILVDEYNKLKDIKFAAPANESLQSYQNKTQAIKSLIFDYISLKNMSDTLSEKYSNLKNKINPFSIYPIHQQYNEKNVELIVLKNQLEKAETPVEKEAIQAKIDILEKEQKERKEKFIDTKSDNLGFLFPEETDVKEASKNISDNLNTYLEHKWNEEDYKNASETYEKLIKDYSDPKIGLQKWNDTVDYWSKEAENKKDKDQKTKDTKVFVNSTESISKDITDLEEQIQTATSQEELDKIQRDIDEKKAQLIALQNDLPDAQPPIEDDKLDEIINTPPTEPQLGVNLYNSEETLSIETPFKTYNKETRNIEDKPAHELVLENSYDHYLTQFVEEFSLNPNKYNVFIIKDTEELMKQRLSKTQLAEFTADRFKEGAIVVFKEKGKDDFVKFEDKPNKPIVAFSFNEIAFDRKINERAEAKAKRDKTNVESVLEFYKEQQQILEDLRNQVIINSNLQIPIKAILGSLGVLPTTENKENAFKRFEGFSSPIIQIVKDENEFPGFSLSTVLLEIPKDKTNNKLPYYIPLSTSNLSANNGNEINTRIHQAVQAISFAKFDTKEEAATIVESFLKNLFYTDKKQFFKVVKDAGKYKILYYFTDKKGVLAQKSMSGLKLNLFESLYNGSKKLSIFEKIDGIYQASEINQDEYKSFIHSNLDTNRKVLVITKGKEEKIFTQPVNAYLNLEKPDYTKQPPVFEQSSSTPITTIEAQKADIERRRQEELNSDELNLYKSIDKIIVPDEIVNINEYHDKQVKIIKENIDKKQKEINAKYDAELATLEKPTEQVVESNLSDIIDMSAIFGEQNPIEVQKTPENLEELIKEKQKEIIFEKNGYDDFILEKGLTDAIKNILKNQIDKKLNTLNKELENLIKLRPKAAIPTPLEKLRTEVAFSQPMSNESQSTIIKANKKEFEINFEANSIQSVEEITQEDIEAMIDVFEKGHAFTFKQLNINGKNVYLVKYNKIGKFVVFDKEFSPLSETDELLNNKEYKDFKDCK